MAVCSLHLSEEGPRHRSAASPAMLRSARILADPVPFRMNVMPSRPPDGKSGLGR